MQSSEDVATMLSHVTTVLDHMTNKKVQHLFLMKGSQRSEGHSRKKPLYQNCCRYLQRLSEKLLYNLRLSNKTSKQCLDMAAKREQASASVDQLQPQYAQLVAITKQLQAQVRSQGKWEERTIVMLPQIAAEISQRYKNRTVNIMGEINQI